MKTSPTYNARTDFATVPISAVPTIPAAGQCALDPDFKVPILRVTGPGLNPQHPDFVYFAGIGGSADVPVWNKQSTKFVFEDQGNRVFIMQFAPLKMQVSPLYPTAFKEGTFCIPNGGRGEFAHYGDVFFQYNGLKILEHDFGQSPSAPPTPKTVYDFSLSALPNFVPLWMTIGGASADGKTFAIAVSATEGQGTGFTILIYRVGKGWRKFDTMTGLVTGQWGQVGTILSSDRFTIHNVKLSLGGKYLVIATAGVTPGSIKNKHFWNLETLEMSVVSNSTEGHWTSGYSHWINQGGPPFGDCQSRLFSASSTPTSIINPMPPPLIPVLDTHLSWNNCDAADSAMIFSTTTSPRDAWQPWQNEVLGIFGGKVYRFCHTMNTGKSPLFSIQNAIGCVDQSGRFMLFCSDWMGQTRGDVFIVPLV